MTGPGKREKGAHTSEEGMGELAAWSQDIAVRVGMGSATMI